MEPTSGREISERPPTPVYGSSRMLDEPTLRWRAGDKQMPTPMGETPAKVKEVEGYNGRTLSGDGDKDGWVGEKAKRPVPTEAGRNLRWF